MQPVLRWGCLWAARLCLYHHQPIYREGRGRATELVITPHTLGDADVWLRAAWPGGHRL